MAGEEFRWGLFITKVSSPNEEEELSSTKLNTPFLGDSQTMPWQNSIANLVRLAQNESN